MKILTLNFLTCAVRNCKTSPAAFPLHVRDAELEIAEIEFQPDFLRNVLPRLDLVALRSVAEELGLKVPNIGGETTATDLVPDVEMGDDAADNARGHNPIAETENNIQDGGEISGEEMKKLHRLLLETQIEKGMLVCGNCGHEYKIMEGIPNFLLPPHLV